MTGVTVLARFRSLPDFNGEALAIDRAGAVPVGGNAGLRAAVANARENYLIITSGGVAAEPPTAIARIRDRVRSRCSSDALRDHDLTATQPPKGVTMDYLVHAAEWFIGLFKAGAETFASWMSGIVPLVLMLLIAMNSIINLIGADKIDRLASKAGHNP